MDEQIGRAEQLELLGRLNDAELVVINERWAGRTSSEIAGALRIDQTVARNHLGNTYDKLDITYVEGGTSLNRVMAFYAVMDDPAAPTIPHPNSLTSEELANAPQPSAQALVLVQEDDEALLAQRPDRVVEDESPDRPWLIPVLIGAIAIVVVIILALVFFAGDDDDDDSEAQSSTATAVANSLDSTATALAGLATIDREDLDATATALSGQATQEREAGDMTATAASNATASAQPTATEEPTATPEPTETPEPTATEEPTAEPTATVEPTEPDATATESPSPPQPAPGELVYESNLQDNPDEWDLNDSWQIEGDALVSSGSGLRTLVAPVTDIATANYAVEATLTFTELEECDGVSGLFGRGSDQSDNGEDFIAGYVGAACLDGWSILAIPDDSPDANELANGDLTLNDQPHTYRLEIAGERIRLFIDGNFAGETTDNLYNDAGSVGLYLNDAINVRVTGFKVFTIEGS